MKSRSFRVTLYATCILGLCIGQALRGLDFIDRTVIEQQPVVEQAQSLLSPAARLLSAHQQGLAPKLGAISSQEVGPKHDTPHLNLKDASTQFQGAGSQANLKPVALDQFAKTELRSDRALQSFHRAPSATAIETDNPKDEVSSLAASTPERLYYEVWEGDGSSANLTPGPDSRPSNGQGALLPSPREEVVVQARRIVKVRTIDDLERVARGNTVLIRLPKSS